MIINVHNGGHWVLATAVNGNVISVNDPGFSTTSYTFDEVVPNNSGLYHIGKGYSLGMMIEEL